jgi:hypothetical protein
MNKGGSELLGCLGAAVILLLPVALCVWLVAAGHLPWNRALLLFLLLGGMVPGLAMTLPVMGLSLFGAFFSRGESLRDRVIMLATGGVALAMLCGAAHLIYYALFERPTFWRFVGAIVLSTSLAWLAHLVSSVGMAVIVGGPARREELSE